MKDVKLKIDCPLDAEDKERMGPELTKEWEEHIQEVLPGLHQV